MQQKGARSAPDVAISVRNLTCKIGSSLILKNIQFDLREHQNLAILGPNGAGKSTLLKCIVGLLHFTGQSEIFGEKIRSNANLKRRLGYLAHETFLYQKLTARENLLFFSDLYGISIDVDSILSEHNLYDVQAQPVETFSRGMKQRLGLARALLNQPEILLLDEPFAGLDQEATELLLHKIQAMKGRVTIVFTSHELDRAEQISDCSLILKNGRQVFFGSVNEALSELYRRSLA
jgi:heme exporter protein A